MKVERKEPTFNLIEAFGNLWLDGPTLSNYQRRHYHDLLYSSKLRKSYRLMSRSVILYFKNGKPIQFNPPLLPEVVRLVENAPEGSVAALNHDVLNSVWDDISE